MLFLDVYCYLLITNQWIITMDQLNDYNAIMRTCRETTRCKFKDQNKRIVFPEVCLLRRKGTFYYAIIHYFVRKVKYTVERGYFDNF